MIKETYNEEETKKIGFEIGKNAKSGEIYCLKGDLGVGKTVFTKGFAEGLGITEHITSPTFTIVNEYYGKLPFYHFDVYRIGDSDEMYDIGCEEYFFGEGVCLIEWAELIEDILPSDVIWISIEKDLDKGLSYRKIEVGK
ncbi:MAG: tRNA (adenosine(37)-N6)-threonylcarbamoyltransferase complex ATPase subunit type 1 TsaE [Lachnospirales bacterium]